MNINEFMKQLTPNGDLTLEQALEKVKELWVSDSELNSNYNCEEKNHNNFHADSKNYFKERQRTYAISEMLRSKFNFKFVNVGYANTDNTRLIEITYNGVEWKSFKIYSDSPDYEIIELIKNALLNNKWDDEYTLSSHSIVLQNIIETYGLSDIDYFQIRNKFCKLNHDAETYSMDEIVDTSKIKGISFDFDDDYLIKLVLTTKDRRYIVNDEDGVTVEKT